MEEVGFEPHLSKTALAIFAFLGIPASTTHAITSSIMGAGAAGIIVVE